MSTSGAFLPDGYEQNHNSEKPWFCPVRDCTKSYRTLHALGAHFTVSIAPVVHEISLRMGSNAQSYALVGTPLLQPERQLRWNIIYRGKIQHTFGQDLLRSHHLADAHQQRQDDGLPRAP